MTPSSRLRLVPGATSSVRYLPSLRFTESLFTKISDCAMLQRGHREPRRWLPLVRLCLLRLCLLLVGQLLFVRFGNAVFAAPVVLKLVHLQLKFICGNSGFVAWATFACAQLHILTFLLSFNTLTKGKFTAWMQELGGRWRPLSGAPRQPNIGRATRSFPPSLSQGSRPTSILSVSGSQARYVRLLQLVLVVPTASSDATSSSRYASPSLVVINFVPTRPRSRSSAKPVPFPLVAAMEAAPSSPASVEFWFILLLVWGSMRSDDLLHCRPGQMELRPEGLQSLCWQTKTERASWVPCGHRQSLPQWISVAASWVRPSPSVGTA